MVCYASSASGTPFPYIESIDGVADLIADLIADIEQDEKGMPILLKQYLKLGGRVPEFNVDDQFNDVLDALTMVGLLATDRRRLMTPQLSRPDAAAGC